MTAATVRAYNDRPARTERPAYTDRPARSDRSDRPAYNDRPARTERPAYNDRPARRPSDPRTTTVRPAASVPRTPTVPCAATAASARRTPSAPPVTTASALTERPSSHDAPRRVPAARDRPPRPAHVPGHASGGHRPRGRAPRRRLVDQVHPSLGEQRPGRDRAGQRVLRARPARAPRRAARPRRHHRAVPDPDRRDPRRASPGATCSAAAVPAPARRWPSACRWSPGSPPTRRRRHPRRPRALVLVPTRELAMQVSDALEPFVHVMGLRHKLVAGGLSYTTQIAALNRGVDLLIATPGRLNDLLERGAVELGDVQIAVLDEADHMAEMGFLPEITAILDLHPRGRPAAALLGDPRPGRRRAGRALPHRRRHPLGRRRTGVDHDDGPPRAPRRPAAQEGHHRRGREPPRAAPWSSSAPSSAPTASPSSCASRACWRRRCTAG